VSFAAITLCVASQRVFIVVSIYFVIDSVRKLLDTPVRSCAKQARISLYRKRLFDFFKVKEGSGRRFELI